MKKVYKIIVICLLLASLTIGFAINNVLPYAILQPQRVKATNYLEIQNVEYEEIKLVSKDSISLQGYYVKSNLDTAYASIILIHGIGGCKEHFSKLAIDLANQGYDSWLFDNRAHGESGGEYTTYGFFEKQDVSTIIDTIEKENPESKIGIWGNSLGGAIAIQTIENDKRVDFGIIESTFTDLNQIVQDYQRRYAFGFGFQWICDLTLEKAGAIAGFNPKLVKPIESVKNIHCPILIAHGNEDENIKYEYGRQLFNSLKAEDKVFVTVDKADHYNMFSVGGEKYKYKLFTFLKRQTNSPNVN